MTGMKKFTKTLHLTFTDSSLGSKNFAWGTIEKGGNHFFSARFPRTGIQLLYGRIGSDRSMAGKREHTYKGTISKSNFVPVIMQWVTAKLEDVWRSWFASRCRHVSRGQPSKLMPYDWSAGHKKQETLSWKIKQYLTKEERLVRL